MIINIFKKLFGIKSRESKSNKRVSKTEIKSVLKRVAEILRQKDSSSTSTLAPYSYRAVISNFSNKKSVTPSALAYCYYNGLFVTNDNLIDVSDSRNHSKVQIYALSEKGNHLNMSWSDFDKHGRWVATIVLSFCTAVITAVIAHFI